MPEVILASAQISTVIGSYVPRDEQRRRLEAAGHWPKRIQITPRKHGYYKHDEEMVAAAQVREAFRSAKAWTTPEESAIRRICVAQDHHST